MISDLVGNVKTNIETYKGQIIGIELLGYPKLGIIPGIIPAADDGEGNIGIGNGICDGDGTKLKGCNSGGESNQTNKIIEC